MKRKFDSLSVLAMCLCTAILTIVVMYAMVFFAIGGKEGLAYYNKLFSVKKVIEEEYVGEVDWNKASDMVSSAIVESTGDRWSYYLTAEEFENYNLISNNSMMGIGVTVAKDPEGRGVEIVSLVDGGAAHKAGIEIGYILLSIEGESLAGVDIGQVGVMVRSHEGEYTVLCLDNEGREVSIILKNEEIYTSPVYYQLFDKIGYIRIQNFERNAAAETMVAIKKLQEQGVQSLIFDVRTNPGGQLKELTQLLDYLLPEGEIFVSVDSEGEEEIYTSNSAFVDMPMVVLIDERTYSAAEFFAAALREYEAAIIIGVPSTGKARSQQTYVLDDGSAVHISTRNYLTPNRVNLADEGGLVPDIIVEAEEGVDAVLEKALEYLS